MGKKNWYNPNCLLNDQNLIKGLCSNKCEQGLEYVKILTPYPSIEEADLKKICEPTGKCPSYKKMTRKIKRIICNLRKNDESEAYIIKDITTYAGNFDPTEIEKVYKN